MAQDRVADILMKRDGLTKREAEKQTTLAGAEIEDAIAAGDFDLAEDIMMSDLGLEMDYVFDVLGF